MKEKKEVFYQLLAPFVVIVYLALIVGLMVGLMMGVARLLFLFGKAIGL